MSPAEVLSGVAEPGSVATSPFLGFAPALNWRWRSNGGSQHYPADMETRHLFHTLRMIWNNVMPEAAWVGRIKLYSFGPTYTDQYMREAVLNIGRELMSRDDLRPDWRAQLDQMAAWLSGTAWATAEGISGPRPALQKAESV